MWIKLADQRNSPALLKNIESIPVALLFPDWPAPATVRACVTTRTGGVSSAPFDSFNLAAHVGDHLLHVQQNRQRLMDMASMPAEPCWLNQVHGRQIADAAVASQKPPDADACYAIQAGIVCSVLTADCLPVLFTDMAGSCVAAAHAGWRGLADGVLETTVGKLPADPESILAWFGPAIGATAFEVGEDVRDVFVSRHAASEQAFVAAGQPSKWYADIYALATIHLASVGVTAIYGGGFCTFSDTERFYSFRRDGQTGRMATTIWLEGT